jgi:hypothetical protein
LILHIAITQGASLVNVADLVVVGKAATLCFSAIASWSIGRMLKQLSEITSSITDSENPLIALNLFEVPEISLAACAKISRASAQALHFVGEGDSGWLFLFVKHP